MTQPISTKMVTGKCRMSYMYAFKARKNDLNGKEEYSVALLIPKSDKKTIKRINDITDSLIKTKWSGKPPATLRRPLRDGDAEDKGEDYAGHYWLNVKSTDAPQIVDQNKDEILDSSQFISGDYGRASINGYAYSQSGNNGVSFGLGNLQKLADGEPLSGRSRAQTDFDKWTEDDEGDEFV